jgi:phosphoglycerate dehydrogenase-like enzyme
MPKKAALFYDYPQSDGEVFGHGRRERIAELTELYPHVVDAGNFEEHAPNLADVEVVFATWGMPSLSDAQLARLPKLEAVFYAAGNVKAFAQPLIDHDITLVSAWAINAIPVAEMCLAQILLSLRGYFRAVREYHDVRTMAAKSFWRPGVLGETIGLIGMGKIGTRLRRELRAYPLRVIAHDPYLTAEHAAELEVEPVALEEVFRRAYVVSNHIPDLPTTQGVLTGALFEAMREGATFINTGRGAQVVEADLIRVLRARPDLTALLDVTWPEPPEPESELWTLPNLVISPHIGGTIGDEVSRLADCAIEEFEEWQAGRPLRYQVTREVLATMG